MLPVLYELNLTEPVALVFGNEHSGVSEELLARWWYFIIPQVGIIKVAQYFCSLRCNTVWSLPAKTIGDIITATSWGWKIKYVTDRVGFRDE